MAEKLSILHDYRQAAQAILGRYFRWRLLLRRLEKSRKLRARAVVLIQAVFRGKKARKLQASMRLQAALVKDWLSAFRLERVPALMGASEASSFYLQVIAIFFLFFFCLIPISLPIYQRISRLKEVIL